jgi:hypothetical protein
MFMKPTISILDQAFPYRPSYATAVTETWARFGWRPLRPGDGQKSQPQPHALSQVARIWKSENAANTGASP